MGNSQAAILKRTAALMSKDDGERTKTLRELYKALDPSNLQTNKTRGQAVLENKAVMDALLDLVATTRSANVVVFALGVLQLLAWDGDNKRRLLQEHPSVVPVAMRKLELGAENATEQVQVAALSVLGNLAINVDNKRDMVAKNPTLVPLLMTKVESSSEQVQVVALRVLHNLSFNVDNKREMVTKNPTLVPLLVAKVEFGSEQVQVGALGVLNSLAVNVDNARDMVTKNPTLVPLLVVKVESNSKQVQIAALSVLHNLSVNADNKRDMVTKNPTFVPLLLAKLESDSDQVQEGALHVLHNLAVNNDNKREMVTKNPTLVPWLMAKVESNSEQVQIGALCVLSNLSLNDDNTRDMITNNPMLVPLIVAELESNLKQVQVKALSVLHNLAFNLDNKREIVTKNPTLVPMLVTKVESNLEQVQEGALAVLHNLSFNVDNKREMVTKNPTLVPLLVTKMESNSEQVQIKALCMLWNLAYNDDNAREMVTKNPTLVPLFVATLESNSEQVQEEVLGMLISLANDVDNAQQMLANYDKLVPLLVTKMSGSTASDATSVIYNLSSSPTNRAILRGNDLVVAALTKGREDADEDTSFFSLLALVNLFGAEEDSKVLKTDLSMLQRVFDLIARAMNKDNWSLNEPLLAFRYLCVVEHNRQLLWTEYGSKFLATILAALQRAIDDKDAPAVENAMSTLAQFSNDTEPLAWMRGNKPELDKVFDQLEPFPDAQRTAQFLQLTLDPPKVAAAPVQVADSKPTIMISYNWKHQAQARLIHSLLESQGYPVWRDEQNMKADIMNAMADAVSKSTVVLVLVSPSYKESANCQMECQFAHRNNRKLIPVLVEPGYVFKADGWLGLLLGGKLYYDVSGFHSAAQMESVVLGLLRSEVEGGQGATTVAPPVAATPKQPVPQNEAEIRQWLSKHKHGEEIADKLVKEDLVEAEDLEMLSKKSAAELKALVELNGKQALRLEAALKELF